MMNPEYEQYWVQICPRIPHSVINHGYALFARSARDNHGSTCVRGGWLIFVDVVYVNVVI
jgi:hypothetical protein